MEKYIDNMVEYKYSNAVLNEFTQMDNKISYTQARQQLKATLDDVANNKTVVTIARRNGEDVVLLSADQYAAMAETLYLLAHPKNAKHLETSLKDAAEGKIVNVDFDHL